MLACTPVYCHTGAQALSVMETNKLVVVDGIRCTSNEQRLRDCANIELNVICDHGKCAFVRCREEWLRVKNVSSATVSVQEYNAMYTVLIFWELYCNASHSPTSFTVVCFNQQHKTELLTNNGTLMQISVGGLLSHHAAAYTCCVSPIYYNGHYSAERKCTLTDSEMLSSDSFMTLATSTEINSFVISASTGMDVFVSNDLNMRVTIIGGVLGFTISILLLLLVICGGALLCLLRSRHMIPKR